MVNRKLCILGSTGSIGQQSLEVCDWHSNQLQVTGLAAANNMELLAAQAKKYQAKFVATPKSEDAEQLEKLLPGGIEIFSGKDCLEKISVQNEVDMVVNGVVGSVGVNATIKAIQSKKDIAFVNKETLVTAGTIVMKEVKKHGVNFLPVDSEHNALFQCLRTGKLNEVKRFIITCSGGSFRGKTRKELEGVTVQQALNHPNWKMGNKITIDSATLMNKGLEVIEAHYLFDLPYEQIDTILHPESIVHSLVEFLDGSVIAEMATHDMRLPIQFALTYPDRLEIKMPRLNLLEVKQLNFSEIDHETFPTVKWAYEAGKLGGTMPAVYNASNEIANEYFIGGKIDFLKILDAVRHAMDEHQNKLIKNPSLEELFEIDAKTREETKKYLDGE